jgi:hypothetical protein
MDRPHIMKARSARYVLMLVLAPGMSHAVDVTLEAGYGATYTNNTQQAPEHGTGEWIQEPTGNLIVNHEGVATTFTADYNATRQIHQRDIYGDETIVAGLSTFTWYAIENRLSFDASNARTQTTINSSGQDVPDNLQVTDTTTAGSMLSLDSISNHLIDIGYHYTFENADRTDTDSRRQRGDVSYVVPMSLRDRFQVNVSVGKVDFDSSDANNYTSHEGNVQYVSQGDNLDLDTSVGYTVFDQENGLDDVTATTGNFDLTWRATPLSTFAASYSRSLGDGALDANSGIPDFGETFTDNSGLTDPYTAQVASLGFDTPLGHNTVGLTTYFRDQKYEDVSDQDQKTVGATLRIQRRLRQTMDATTFVDYSETEFDGEDRTDHDFSAGLRIEWARWRNLSLFASTIYTKRNSDDAASEFTEWEGSFSLMYTLMGPGATVSRRATGAGAGSTSRGATSRLQQGMGR